MFEKEADEYALEESTACDYGESTKHVYRGYFYGFQKGAEFGYGKGKSEAAGIIKDLLSLKTTVSSAEDVRKRFSVRERALEFLKE